MYVLFWLLEKQAGKRDPQLSPVAVPATVMPATTQPRRSSAPRRRRGC